MLADSKSVAMANPSRPKATFPEIPFTTTSHCPFKGDASYYSIATQDRELTDVVWSYETPYPAVDVIAGHVAFYPQHVELTVGGDQ